jgi:hypothetical protein
MNMEQTQPKSIYKHTVRAGNQNPYTNRLAPKTEHPQTDFKHPIHTQNIYFGLITSQPSKSINYRNPLI